MKRPAATTPMGKDEVLAWLAKHGSRRVVAGMARYDIRAERAYGVTMGTLKGLARQLGQNHALAVQLWESGWYEARLLAALVGDPRQVTRTQMNAWARNFENWADCDTVCFALWDRTPLAWERAHRWSASPLELVKRGGFVLMACLALHDKTADDEPFLEFLPRIERGARDARNFVKKGVSWALRAIGRRNAKLHAAASNLAERLAQADLGPARWVGRDALRELSSPKVRALVAKRTAARSR